MCCPFPPDCRAPDRGLRDCVRQSHEKAEGLWVCGLRVGGPCGERRSLSIPFGFAPSQPSSPVHRATQLMHRAPAHNVSTSKPIGAQNANSGECGAERSKQWFSFSNRNTKKMELEMRSIEGPRLACPFSLAARRQVLGQRVDVKKAEPRSMQPGNPNYRAGLCVRGN